MERRKAANFKDNYKVLIRLVSTGAGPECGGRYARMKIPRQGIHRARVECKSCAIPTESEATSGCEYTVSILVYSRSAHYIFEASCVLLARGVPQVRLRGGRLRSGVVFRAGPRVPD